MLFKNSFSLPHLFYMHCRIWIQLISQHQSSDILILETEMLIEFQKKTNIEMMCSN